MFLTFFGKLQVKLFHVKTSPFVRKVIACAIARDILPRLTLVPAQLYPADAALLDANPLSKVPCLVTDDGLALFDSPVICEFLDSVGEAQPMFPASGGARWRALKQQALADGIMDAAVARRQEQGRPREEARDAVMSRHAAAVDRALAQLEADLPHKAVDIGTISVACALGYLDFRYAGEPWRPAHPQLAAWHEGFAANPAMVNSRPDA